jgi:hypothetical protein
VDIGVKDSDSMAHRKKGIGKVHGNGAFSHTALSAHDEDLAIHEFHPVVDVDFLNFAFAGHVFLRRLCGALKR